MDIKILSWTRVRVRAVLSIIIATSMWRAFRSKTARHVHANDEVSEPRDAPCALLIVGHAIAFSKDMDKYSGRLSLSFDY
jgi:hypothetical protein